MSSDMTFIVAGWGVTLTVLGAYAVSLVLRGRRLSREVPPERRRWTN